METQKTIENQRNIKHKEQGKKYQKNLILNYSAESVLQK